MWPQRFEYGLETIQDVTEKIGSDFRVICGRMRRILIPSQPRRLYGTRENGLPVCDARQSRSIEATERVKRIALDRCSLGRFVEESQIKGSIVPDEDRTRAAALANGAPYFPEDTLQCVAFLYCRAQRIVGIDPVDGQRCRFEIGAFERLDVITMRFAAAESAVFLCFHQNCCNLEQSIGLRIEATRLDIHDDG